MSTTIEAPPVGAPPETPALTEWERLIRTEAERLDRLVPGWANKVKVESLNMATATRCVLGQVYDTFDEGLTAVTVDGYCHGGAYSDHDDEWIAEILARR